MKRGISLILAVGIAAGTFLFGETGALGHKWGEDKQRNLDKEIYEQDSDGISIKNGMKNILNETTDVYYFYAEDYGLVSITFNVTKTQLKDLKNKLKLIKTYKNLNSDILYNIEEDKKIALFYIPFFTSFGFELYGETSLQFVAPPQKNQNKGQLSIYDYNNDTRVHIYENINEGQTVVVYILHEQDY